MVLATIFNLTGVRFNGLVIPEFGRNLVDEPGVDGLAIWKAVANSPYFFQKLIKILSKLTQSSKSTTSYVPPALPIGV